MKPRNKRGDNQYKNPDGMYKAPVGGSRPTISGRILTKDLRKEASKLTDMNKRLDKRSTARKTWDAVDKTLLGAGLGAIGLPLITPDSVYTKEKYIKQRPMSPSDLIKQKDWLNRDMSDIDKHAALAKLPKTKLRKLANTLDISPKDYYNATNKKAIIRNTKLLKQYGAGETYITKLTPSLTRVGRISTIAGAVIGGSIGFYNDRIEERNSNLVSQKALKEQTRKVKSMTAAFKKQK